MNGGLIHREDETADRLEEAVLAYLQAEDAGRAPPSEEMLRDYPELAGELSSFLGDQERLGEALAPLADLLSYVSPPIRSRRELVGKPLPRSFGRYELLAEIGRGGMGVVYRARHLAVKREVALKTIRGDYSTDASGLARFRNEIDSIVSLEHSHIVPILDVGAHDEQLYFTMPLLAGAATPRQMQAFREDPKAAAAFVAQIAQALHFAHQRGVLHRDIKPSNILVDEEGRPFLADFGLAKRIDRETGLNERSLTETGAVLGTPAYLAPENTISRKEFTVAGDVYGLGAVLYTLLAGRPPFEGDMPWETARRIREEDAAPLEKINPAVDRDLAAICHKCLEKAPAKRYASAAGLANDLDRYLAGEAIEARPIGNWDRAGRWIRKRALAVSIAAAFAVVLLGAIAILATSVVLVSRSRAEVESQANSLRKQVYAADMRQAFGYWQSGEREALAATLTKYDRPHFDENDLRGFEWGFLRTTVGLALKERVVYRGHEGIVCHAVFSPNGELVASAGVDGAIHLWEAATGIRKVVLPGDLSGSSGHRGYVNWIEFAPDGHSLATTGDDGAARLWRLAPPYESRVLHRSESPKGGISFSPSGEFVVCSDADVALVYLTSDGALQAQFSLGEPVLGAGFLVDGKTIVAGGVNGKFAAWDWPSKSPMWTAQHRGSLVCLGASPDGKTIASIDNGSFLQLLDSKSGESVARRRVENGVGRGLAFDPKGRRLATCGSDGEFNLWSSATLARLARTRSHGDVCSVSFSQSGEQLVTTGRDELVRVWELPAYDPCESIDSRHFLSRVQWSPSGRYLLIDSLTINGGEQERAIWSRREQRVAARWTAKTGHNHGCAWTEDERLLGAVEGGEVWRWDWRTGERVRLTPPQGKHAENPGIDKYIRFVAPYDRDGSLAVLCSDGYLHTWELDSKKTKVNRELAGDWPVDLAIPARGAWIVGARDAGLKLWDFRQRRWMSFPGREMPAGSTLCLALSPDATQVAIGEKSGKIQIRLRATGELLFTLLGHRSGVGDLEYAPDGKTLVSGGSDGTVRLWSLATGQELFTLEDRQNDVASVAISPDGELLAVGGRPLANGDCVSLYRLRQQDTTPR